jgi:hypothetical protein
MESQKWPEQAEQSSRHSDEMKRKIGPENLPKSKCFRLKNNSSLRGLSPGCFLSWRIYDAFILPLYTIGNSMDFNSMHAPRSGLISLAASTDTCRPRYDKLIRLDSRGLSQCSLAYHGSFRECGDAHSYSREVDL